MPDAQETVGVSLVIPAYDEQESLKALLPRIDRVVQDLHTHRFEVIVVVEKEPPQDTIDLIRSYGGQAIEREPTNSFGDAMRAGINASSPSSLYVVCMDADGSHPPETLPRLLAHAGTADVVVASRYVSGGSTENSVLLRSMSRVLNRTYSLVLGIRCKDVSTNFKLYRADLLKSIELTCVNFDVVEEILVRLQQASPNKGLTILEIPDHFAERKSGESKRRLSLFIASYIWTLARLRFSDK